MTGASGLDPASAGELRRLVREVLAEVLPAAWPAGAGPSANGSPAGPGRPPGTLLTAGGVPSGVPAGRPATAASSPAAAMPEPGRSAGNGGSPAPGFRAGPAPPASSPGGPAPDQAGAGSWDVRIGSDADLREFALRVLKLADNPKQRRDLVAGRIRFRLAGPPEFRPETAQLAGQRAVHRVDKGAVTERTVTAAATAGARLVLGPRAVLTPLGKDKARALGVPIDKER